MLWTIVNGVRKPINYTEDELEQIANEHGKIESIEKHRPLTESEVTTMLIKSQINTFAVDDQTALRMIAYYPAFGDIIGQTVKAGFKFTYNGKLYKVVQPELTIAAHYPPDSGTESMYTRIDETHDGTKYDPIPYDGNMVLEQGTYYTQDGITYLCTRDTGNVVYHALRDLVGLYVDAAE